MRELLAKLPYQKFYLDLSSSNITTAAWAEIFSAANNLKGCTAIQYFYSGAGILKLSNGDALAEDANEMKMYLFPGGVNQLIPFELARLKRLSARAVDQNVTTGLLVINFFG